MVKLLRSILRIAVAAAASIALLIAAAVVFTRQPVFSSLAYRGGNERSNPSLLARDVAVLTAGLSPRNAAHPENLDRAADWVAASFRKSGGRVDEQRFMARGRQWRNVIARFGPVDGARSPLVVGAHYDAFGETGDKPGADDNASGTAGLLALATLLGRTPPRTTVTLVAFTNEEPPFFGSAQMGSAVHAASLSDHGQPTGRMLCLEMIGFFSPEQTMPSPILALFYPSAGDFIAITGGVDDVGLTRLVKRAMIGAGGIATVSFTGPREVSDASDQRNYWASGWKAVMITDTAFLRNRHYHTAGDTAATLDYPKMARVVDGVFNAVLYAAEQKQ